MWRPGFTFLLGVFVTLTAATAFSQNSSTTREVSLSATVVDDYGRPVSGLGRERFKLFEKNSPLEITSFAEADTPTSVVFLFDLSGSMTRRFENAAAEGVFKLIHTANQDNQYLVLGFDKDISTLSDWGADPEVVRKALLKIEEHTPLKNTAFYDACAFALEKLQTSKHTTQMVLLFSDGLDNTSKLSFKKLADQIRGSGVTFYAIGLFSNTILGIEGQGVLDDLSGVSGGISYYPHDTKELMNAVDQVSFASRHRYVIGFRPASSALDGKWHPIKLKLTLPRSDAAGHKNPHLNVRSRNGYYDR